MRFFFWRNRFTEEQKVTLEKVIAEFNTVVEEQATALSPLYAYMTAFLLNCRNGQQAGLGRSLKPPEDQEVEDARRILESCRPVISSAHAQLKAIVIPTWAPPRFSAAQEWGVFFDGPVGFVDRAIKGLEPPDPLVDRSGEAKLNMFLSGVGFVTKLVTDFRDGVHRLKI